MESADAVTLDAATQSDALLLANLLELYIHDLSDVFPGIEIGSDGRFGYSKLPFYWSEPDRRLPFLIRSGGRVAGFVLATRGSPAMPRDADVLDVAEFFVLRRYRRAGVGRRAASLLWQRLPGRWIVRVSEGNRDGLVFWSRVVAELTNGAARESTLTGQPNNWRVFSFG